MTRRPAVHTETLLALAAVFMLLAGNGPWWRAALAQRPWSDPGTWVFAGAVFVTLACFYFAFTALLATRHTVKPLLALLLVLTAFASYFMERYAVYLDRPMIRNVFATNPKEAGELLGFRLAWHVFLFGVLPSAVIAWLRVAQRPWKRAVAVRLGFVAGAIALGTASLVLVFADAASLMRKNREMRWLITPGNIVAAVAAETFATNVAAGPKLPIAPDAKRDAAPGQRPMLFVLVVGETARAQNFSLNGYARETDPELKRRNVINFPDATACGTSTEVSLPCMFSAFGRSNYDERKILSHESVLHVLARAGVGVLWRDNQSGCKGVCEGLPQQQFEGFDEVLLDGMDRVLRDAKGNLLVVMHQLGSHGPAYYRRYPPAFARFLPACGTDELRQCPDAEIVNAYDNTILYSDHVLGRLIDWLAAQKTHDTGMLYVSDHGESLGESGLYLHGVPYAIAPAVQTRVPFVVWLSPALQQDAGIDDGCLRRRAQKAVSHDHLFHTLLGIFSVRTKAYEPALDVFAGCRTKRSN
ncbi:phosphoethanolamine transferase [Ramlibacter sp. PS4R-6]|uniref:phosphoethanolamine transferase n=1 Tax=Ramlibacter sp. PS4R-6 TaxID=3133438 RepID=UPI0030A18DFC